jgi:hypothetical protein
VRKGVLTLVALLGALAGLLPGRADAAVTATGIRIADHPAFVRVVVDFEGGRISNRRVFAVDPGPMNGSARLTVDRRGIDTDAAAVTARGVHATLTQATNRLVLRLTFAGHRFKYVYYNVLHSPERLYVDLWKAKPPTGDAVLPTAPQGGCLTIDAFSVGPGTASASGTEHDLFEHQFQLNLRRATGTVARTVGVAAAGGSWSRTFSYTVASRQRGTLEAVDLSEKDGSLVCIAQVRVTLRPPPR